MTAKQYIEYENYYTNQIELKLTEDDGVDYACGDGAAELAKYVVSEWNTRYEREFGEFPRPTLGPWWDNSVQAEIQAHAENYFNWIAEFVWDLFHGAGAWKYKCNPVNIGKEDVWPFWHPP